MDRSRLIVLGLAGLAAIVAALMVRGLFGGGTTKSVAAVAPKPAVTLHVLVAATDIQPGSKITPQMVKWQTWPRSATNPTFISTMHPQDPAAVVAGTVARGPILSGQPLTTTLMVHAASAGFMSAQLTDGMRAISIQISDNTGAGGFILPNDRVDVLLTRALSSGANSETILEDVRVLAIGQTYQQEKDEKVISGKTATLEVSPAAAERLARATALGTLTLALRPLVNDPVAQVVRGEKPMAVIRYGIGHVSGQQQD